jgi:hypothetical protein
MPKGKSKKGRKSERLEFRIGVKSIDPRILRGHDRADVATAAVKHFIRTGEETPGVKLVGRWRNPDNKNPLHKNWKTSEDDSQDLDGFYRTIVQRTHAKASRFKGFEPTMTPAEKRQAKRTFEERSVAAKKGVVTRKREAEATKRVAEMRKRAEAGRKAWKTRQRKARFL